MEIVSDLASRCDQNLIPRDRYRRGGTHLTKKETAGFIDGDL